MSIELLSPAGDMESLKMAVFGGANAVYFGAKNFNARAKAQNFDTTLQEAIAFCHMHGVKAYLTLNTLLENEEVNELLNVAKTALEFGVDAFIVQDFGVFYLLKNYFKNVEIHTSTQMAINNYLGAQMAYDMGAKRVVLSRETCPDDIKLIKQKTNIEIECFIQGALCVGFSGNCYLSSYLFNKSGNRGECLQPCRLLYSAYKDNKKVKEGYLFSAKDNCMAHRLKELADCGVDSFKIEGRLRRAGYVATTTREYRKIIDNNFEVNSQSINNLKKAFNRGDYTEGYLNGNSQIIEANIQNHKGVKIGQIVGFNSGKKFNILEIKSSHEIVRGDVLKLINNQKEVATITAYDVKKKNNIYEITTTTVVPVGTNVNLILDSVQEKNYLNSVKKLNVDFCLAALSGERISLKYIFGSISGEVLGDVCERAKTQPLTQNQAKEQLSKLTETNFNLDNFSFITDGVFVSKKQLNELRNEAIKRIMDNFKQPKSVECNLASINDEQQYINKNNFTLEISNQLTSNADFFVVRPENYLTFDYNKISHKNAYLYIPSFMTNEDIEIILNILNSHPNLGVYAENIGALAFNKKTILGAKLNIKNKYALKQLINKNVVAVVLSPELTNENFQELSKKTSLPTFKSNFDKFDLITFVHCPIKTLHNNDCGNCKYSKDIMYKMENGKQLYLKRNIIKHCYFFLTNFVDNNSKILYTTK